MRIATQLSIDTKAIADHLRGLKQGESVSFEELRQKLALDVQDKSRHSLQSARRVLLREGIRFDAVRGVGLQRMTDAQVATSGARSVRLVHGVARREAKKMAAISDFESLTNDEKIQHNTTLSVLGAVAHFSKPAQVKILEAAVSQAKNALPTRESIDVIRLALSSGGKK